MRPVCFICIVHARQRQLWCPRARSLKMLTLGRSRRRFSARLLAVPPQAAARARSTETLDFRMESTRLHAEIEEK